MEAFRNYDPYVRGVKDRAPLHTGVLSLLRVASPCIQYYLLTSPLLPSLITDWGSDALPPLNDTVQGPGDLLRLAPGRFALLSMSIGATLKHAIWATFLNAERLHGASAISIGLVNIAFDSLASLLYLWRVTCPAGPAEELTPVMLVALSFCVAGIVGELAAEVERHMYKQDPRNHGKLYTRGLWAWTRHPNYTGYILWRFGHAMACMGYLGIIVALSTHAADIAYRAVPINENYCQKKVRIPPMDLPTALLCAALAYRAHQMNAGAVAWKLWTTGAAPMPVGWIVTWKLMYKPSDKFIAIQNLRTRKRK